MYEVRTAQAGVSSLCLSSLLCACTTTTQGRKLPTVGPGCPFQCVPQFLLKGRSRAEVCQDRLIATEVPLYHCHTQDWAGRSLPSSFPIGKSLSNPPPGASPWETPKLGPRALERARRGWGFSQPGPPQYRSQPPTAIESGLAPPPGLDLRYGVFAATRLWPLFLQMPPVPHSRALCQSDPNHARFQAMPHLAWVHWSPSSA